MRMAEHGQQAEFDLRDGRLMPGHQHAGRQADRLFLGRFALVNRCEQIRQQVATRILPLVSYLAANVAAQFFPGRARRVTRAAFMLVRHNLVGQPGEKGVILVEHPHQRADDHGRKGKREMAAQVRRLGLGRQRFEQLCGDRLDLLREQLQPSAADAGATIVRKRACSLPSCEPSHPGEPRITVAGVTASGGIPEGLNAGSDRTALASS